MIATFEKKGTSSRFGSSNTLIRPSASDRRPVAKEWGSDDGYRLAGKHGTAESPVS